MIRLEGMRHIALRVADMKAARAFYEGALGLKVVWAPDPANVYLSSGTDNIALHESQDRGPAAAAGDRLDHFGFVLADRAEVDRAQEELQRRGIAIARPARDHRDGSRSFYIRDPDGNLIQFLTLPKLK